LIQAIAPANAQTTGSITFIPDPNAGENSKSYFIKMISINFADPAMPQYKATAYSAMFELTGMTGKFNSVRCTQCFDMFGVLIFAISDCSGADCGKCCFVGCACC
jgi:hypothetical protein